MNEKKVVELIPWVHSAGYNAHYVALKYISGLKKGSVLGLEIDPNLINMTNSFLETIANHKSLENNVLYRDYLYPSKEKINLEVAGRRKQIVEAVMQVVFTCKERNIKIIILGKDKYRKQRNEAHYKKGEFEFNTHSNEQFILRDKEMAESVITYLKKGDKIFVLCGVAHMLGMQENIEGMFKERFSPKHKLFVGVNDGIFELRERMLMNRNMLYFYYEKYKNKVVKTPTKFFVKANPEKEKWYLEELNNKLKKLLNHQDKRVTKKLEERKIKDDNALSYKAKRKKMLALRPRKPI